MAEQFYTILTAVGKAKIANATVLGKKVELTELALGDGGGSYYNPTEDQTELRNEVWRGAIGTVDVDEENPNWITIQTVVPSQHGGFMIREAGVFDNEGDLIAVGKYPETYKPAIADGSIKDLVVKMILEVSNTTSVVLKVDPTVVATQQQVNEAEARAKQYTDQEVAEVSQALTTHLADYASHMADYANHGNLKNKIINGNFVINQRRASTKAQPVGVYGYDRWKGHANGIEQVIEALPAGTYTLSWQGGGTGTFGGITKASPITATVTAGNRSVVVPATATKVQLEEGNYATPFEQRPIGLELMLCQRYCLYIGADDGTRAWAVQPNVLYFNIPLPTTMRTVPSLESGSLIVRPINLSSTETGFTFSFLTTPRSNTLTIKATKTAHGLSDAMLYLADSPVFSAEL